jgi:hypothetical protein
LFSAPEFWCARQIIIIRVDDASLFLLPGREIYAVLVIVIIAVIESEIGWVTDV